MINRTTLKNPTARTQATLEHAITLLVGCIGKDADPESAVRAVIERIAHGDTHGQLHMGKMADGLHNLTASISAEANDLWANYGDAEYHLRDNPDSLSLCDAVGGAVGDRAPSLGRLPPAVRAHLGRRHRGMSTEDRKAIDKIAADGEPELADALDGWVRDRNAVAAENASAASNANAIADQETGRVPLCILGPGGDYTTQIGVN